jgi:hypothetical protein
MRKPSLYVKILPINQTREGCNRGYIYIYKVNFSRTGTTKFIKKLFRELLQLGRDKVRNRFSALGKLHILYKCFVLIFKWMR